MIVLIACEKGETGKIMIAINLAFLRAKQDKDVLIVDTLILKGQLVFGAG